MTQEEFLQFSEEMHKKAHGITAVKNTDYSPGTNPFSNFEKLMDRFGPDWPVKLLASRIQEKCDRIVNYAVKGKSEANSEPLDNDFLDIGNYAILMLGYIKFHRPAEK